MWEVTLLSSKRTVKAHLVLAILLLLMSVVLYYVFYLIGDRFGPTPIIVLPFIFAVCFDVMGFDLMGEVVAYKLTIMRLPVYGVKLNAVVKEVEFNKSQNEPASLIVVVTLYNIVYTIRVGIDKSSIYQVGDSVLAYGIDDHICVFP